jgi:hypothetical protein
VTPDRHVVIAHEAGHAVVARHYGVRITKIVIEDGGGGWVDIDKTREAFPSLYANVVYLMAGAAAERIFLDRESGAGAAIDIVQALSLVELDEGIVIYQAAEDANRILDDEKDTWTRLVDQLTAGEMDLSWFNRGIHCDET